MGSPFVRVLASSLLLPLLAVTSGAQRDYLPSGNSRYTGRAWNTTSDPSIQGDVVLVISDADLRLRTVSVKMSFSDGLCGEGESTGSFDRGVLTLFGELSSHGGTCGEQSWTMVTSCTVSPDGDLRCEYWLYPRRGFQAVNQKGYFEVRRAVNLVPLPSPIPPQRAESTARPDTPSSSFFLDEADPGVDFATVIASQANLRQGPDGASSVLLEVRSSDHLVLLNRTPTGSWYNVLHVDSNTDGWIHGSVIRLVYTRKARPAPVLRAEQVDTYSDPRIELDNKSYKDLNLKVGETIYSIPAYSKRSVTFSSGVHKYYASASGVLPAMGEQTFVVGHRYIWTFWIRTGP